MESIDRYAVWSSLDSLLEHWGMQKAGKAINVTLIPGCKLPTYLVAAPLSSRADVAEVLQSFLQRELRPEADHWVLEMT